MLLGELREKLPDEFSKFYSFNQGSYAFGTGIMPKNGNYDIDVGLAFPNIKDFFDPIETKLKIWDALVIAKRTVKIRQPCVTVEYLLDGEPQYHIDLAIYSINDQDNYSLAMGKDYSNRSLICWEKADPRGLISKVNSRFSDENKAQFRRILRYLKKWRDYKITNDHLISIALTIAAYNWLSPYIDILSKLPNDIKALENLLSSMLLNWSINPERLSIILPVEPYNDLLGGMSLSQMEDLKEKIIDFRDSLIDVQIETNLRVACTTLAKYFGEEFPIPSDDDQRARVGKSYVSTGTSAR